MEVIEDRFGFTPGTGESMAGRVRRRYRFCRGVPDMQQRMCLLYYTRGQVTRTFFISNLAHCCFVVPPTSYFSSTVLRVNEHWFDRILPSPSSAIHQPFVFNTVITQSDHTLYVITYRSTSASVLYPSPWATGANQPAGGVRHGSEGRSTSSYGNATWNAQCYGQWNGDG
jgi:hypothetical protein